MDIFERLQNLDKRVFYVLMALAIAIPTINPIGLPVEVTEQPRKVFEFVETLPEGSRVVVGFDYEPGDEIDLNPQIQAIFHQLARKKIKVVCLASFPSAPLFIEECVAVLVAYGYQYGQDYVNLGYYAGGESTLAAFGNKPSSIFSRDFHGHDVASLPLMQEIQSMKDFAMAITLNDGPTGGTGTHEWVRQSFTAHGVPLVMGVTGVLAATNMTYVQGGQCKGILGGLRAAAEYEKLIGKKGTGTVGMDAQSMAHVLIVAFVVLGNVALFLSKPRSRAPGGGERA